MHLFGVTHSTTIRRPLHTQRPWPSEPGALSYAGALSHASEAMSHSAARTPRIHDAERPADRMDCRSGTSQWNVEHPEVVTRGVGTEPAPQH